MSDTYTFFTALISGGVAGLLVDVALFPIDTIKTRLQSEQGFWRSGGFRNVYKGLGPVAISSAPTSALFFCTYETIKYHIGEKYPEYKQSPYLYMLAATIGEIIACSIRVPVEIVKQRRQVMQIGTTLNRSAIEILWNAYKTEGIRKGLYRGYMATLLREVPFSFIQFPLWEYFKQNWCNVTGFDELTPFSVALCGAGAGGIAAGITTPLDVIKTRIMLAESEQLGQKLDVKNVSIQIYRSRGLKGLFVGFIPRVMWITIGGTIYFGFYDLSTRMLTKENNNSFS